MIKLIKGDLFTAPPGSILAHACNCQGVWGSGIAHQFKMRFPGAFLEYEKLCKSRGGSLVGGAHIIPGESYDIGCLFTSVDYGALKDTPADILDATETAVARLIDMNLDKKPIAMCKINAGLFAVPWEETVRVLEKFHVELSVYEPEYLHA